MKIPMTVKDNWNIPCAQALKVQKALAEKISRRNSFESIRDIKTIGGIDVSYGDHGYTYISYVLCSYPGMRQIETVSLSKKFARIMPYVPAYLSFRELPPVLSIMNVIKTYPDCMLFDGQGIAHPRRMGLAAHAGVVLDIPSIGCAKSHLYGIYQVPPPGLRGAFTMMRDESGEYIGIVLRTRMYVKPLFVSPGHKIDIETAGDIVMGCVKKSRIPEPLRLAHIQTQRARRKKGRLP